MIINYEELEAPIKSIEAILDSFDAVEKTLILQQIRMRIAKAVQKQAVSDNVNSHPLMKFASKFMKDHDERDL